MSQDKKRETIRKLTKDDLERMNVPRRYWGVKFDGIQEGVHKEVIRRYVEQIDQMVKHGYGLLLWGSNGVGKTSAAVHIAKEARRMGHPVLFVRAADYRDAVFDHQLFDRETTWTKRARSVKLLVLDDLGKEGADSRGHSQRVYEDLIRHRVSEKLATIATTNFTMEKFTDEAKGGYRESFIAAMKGSLLPIEYEGKDLRENMADDLVRKLGLSE